MEAYQDGVNADRKASDYKKMTTQVNRTTKIRLPLASGGGWAARVHQ
jgi:alpha-glucosidase